METLKKHWKTILIIGLVALAIWYFFLRKKKVESGYATIAPFKRALDIRSMPLQTGLKTCSCSRLGPDGKYEVWTKTGCTKSASCEQCCDQGAALPRFDTSKS